MPSALLTPVKVGGLELPNRVAMAAMTRGRCGAGGVPTALQATYYAQRASAGVIVTEGTFTSRLAEGWVGAPGIYTPQQVAGWKEVVDVVQAAGGRIFCQLWHMGRASHSLFREAEEGDPRSVSASAVAMEGVEVHVPGGAKVPAEVPRALETEEVEGLAAEYRRAAECAKEAGFDGVEVHCANGYLLNGFLDAKTNLREDKYGGSKEKRFQVVREVLDAVLEVYPAGSVGVKISPNGVFNDMGSESFREDYLYYVGELKAYGLGYLCAMVGLAFGFHNKGQPLLCSEVREAYGDGVIMANCGYDKAAAEKEIADGNADLVAFGRPYIPNPDLVERFAAEAELAADAPMSVWYSPLEPKEVGYTDYTAMKTGA